MNTEVTANQLQLRRTTPSQRQAWRKLIARGLRNAATDSEQGYSAWRLSSGVMLEAQESFGGNGPRRVG